MTDTEALDTIRALLDGQEWRADTLESVAEVLWWTGRAVEDPCPLVHEGLHEGPIVAGEDYAWEGGPIFSCLACGQRIDTGWPPDEEG